MKLEFENISQFDSQQLYELLLPVINEIREDFSYVLISDQDYSLLVLEEIAKSKESYSGKVSYYDFLKKNINMRLSQMVKEELTNSKTSFSIINNYINQRFSNISRYEESLKCFRELSSFFEKYNFIPSLDLLSDYLAEMRILVGLVE